MGFTDNQQKAIDLRDRNILVSAAAGSGKTSVLVERIINRITIDNPVVDIDRMLIMTFTNAAAKEMRDRIRDAIEKKLSDNKNDENLIRQSVLIHNAMITTIHGFCQSVIRDHFEKLSIDPSFRVADENECKLLEYDAVDSVLEAYYDEGRQEFLDVVECFAGNKSDEKLAELILNVYRFSRSNPDPEAYLDNLVVPYSAKDLAEFEQLPFVDEVVEYAKTIAPGLYELVCKCVNDIDSAPGLIKYKKAFESDKHFIKNIADANTFDEFVEGIKNISFEKLAPISASKLSEDDAALQAELKKARDNYKAGISKLEKFFYAPINIVYEQMAGCKEQVAMLSELVKAFDEEYSARKRDKNIIDFSDMEHMAIRVLTENEEIANSYRDQFVEIYVDEYQDSNMTQETLLDLIKRQNPCGNLFMVGDVKQSIYRFRQARPDLFISKYDSYELQDSVNQKVLLNDNFRSRKEVIEAVNEVFTAIMKKSLGGIEYDEAASLKYGAKYYDDADKLYNASDATVKIEDGIYKAEYILCKKGSIPRIEMEAECIAERIKKIVYGKMPVFDKDAGIIRPAKYRDIVILVRSLKGYSEEIKRVLDGYNIPVSVSSSTGYFSTTEIKTALAFLQTIDNPMQDVALATFMRCPVIGFSDEDLAVLRSGYTQAEVKRNKELLYKSVNDVAMCTDENKYDQNIINKCKNLLAFIEYYRNMATFTPVYGILRDFIQEKYGDYVRCMDRSAQRIANLNALVVKAEEYSKTSFSGLFNFVRYIDLIKKYEIEDGEINVLGEDNDVVRIMTIHKSKGLEFPVCIVAGMEKGRNTKDETGNVVWDADYGIGINNVDIDKRTTTKTLYKNVISQYLKNENIAEELRVLYVALTRAREKLIMVGFDSKDSLTTSKGDISEVASYQDMIAIAKGERDAFLSIDVTIVDEADLVIDSMAEEISKDLVRDEFLDIIRQNVNADNSTKGKNESVSDATDGVINNENELQDVIEVTYPHEHKYNIPAKLSVSELKHSDIERKRAEGSEVVEAGMSLFSDTDPDTYIPNFMLEEGQTKSGATFFGTAFHRILELWEYDIETPSEEDVAAFVNEMALKKKMSKEQAEAIRTKDVVIFLHSDLGNRMYAAKQNNNLFREQPFMIGVPESEIAVSLGLADKDEAENANDGNASEQNYELIIVQGIIDAYIVEDDGISIIDYKTDNVSNESILINRYTAQLEYYRKALEQITGNVVKELVIYSSKLGKGIKF